ncbi:YchJ family protein [Gordonia paraffinivorans]|uniref:YchJ family protein n=1 Tax=Gordonia paraffinivorans TaxID=175628 RepID=UPI0014482D84|nr:YchJ family metal-binding protein [Gordonia paraffinivorans]
MNLESANRDPDARCPCLSGFPFGECCGPVLDGTRPAPTAEALMRSRFTAFVVGDREHVLRSWHPRTRPTDLSLDEKMRWYRLDVESTRGGSPFDTDGEVTFTVYYRVDSDKGTLHERSRFTRYRGEWVYVDGVIA